MIQKRQYKRFSLGVLLVVPLVLFGLVLSVHSPQVQAAPGSPGQPEAPVLIYDEDFENDHSTGPVALDDYEGSEDMTYTAASAWLNNCNGELLFFSMDDDEFDNSNCSVGDGTNTTTAFDAVRRLAHALGTHGGTTATTNRALTAYTDNGASFVNPGADLVQFETEDRVSISSRRFVISGVDVAAINCSNPGTVQGKLAFYLLDGSDTRKINQTAINICTNSGASTLTPPSLQSNGALAANSGSIKVGTVLSDRALLSNSSSVGLRMVNEEGGGQGNDNAIDNIQMVDASPKLDKSFDPTTVEVGGLSRMTFTVTNTTDLLAKNGWSFTDTLPTDLMVADDPNVETDCPSGSVMGQPGSSTVSYAGNLSADMVSCTLSIDVTSDVAGTYSNGPGNLSEVVGLHLPADAEVTFVPKAPDAGKNNTPLKTALYASTAATGAGLLIRRKFMGARR